MKKIVVLLLLVLALTGCQMYKTQDTVIENKSDYAAIIDVKNFKENEKQILSYKFTVDAGKSLLLPMYDNSDVSLVSIGRNYLNKVSNTRYEILNGQSVIFTVYNKTNESDIVLRDVNALFNTQTLAKDAEIQIQVYNHLNIQPIAINSKGVMLQVKVQARSIIVLY